MFPKLVLLLVSIFLFNPPVLADSLPQVLDEKFIEFKIPIFPNGYEIHETFDRPHNTKAIFYKARVSYPAKEVLDYYDQIFHFMGMIPFYDDNYGDKKWYSYIDATRPEKPEVHQLIANWVDKNKKIRIVLALRYVSSENKTQKEELEVICQVQPFFLMPP